MIWKAVILWDLFYGANFEQILEIWFVWAIKVIWGKLPIQAIYDILKKKYYFECGFRAFLK